MTGRTAGLRLASAAALLTAVVAATVGAFYAGDGLFGAALVWLGGALAWVTTACLTGGAVRDPASPPRPIREPQPDAQWWRDAGCPHTADLIERGHLNPER